ncbi:MAG: hypothetical protein SFU98_17115 [Leptospiraceae bacterium]|nr:hypothetical protein [Leptospiraceae bacterium]
MKFVLIFILLVNSIFSEKLELIPYSTESVILKTNLDKDNAKLVLEYIDEFSILIYGFLAEVRNESPKRKIVVELYSDCRDLKSVSKGSRPVFFFRTYKSSWSRFKLKGCYLTKDFFFQSIQHSIAEAMLSYKDEKVWFTQGLATYFTNSIFIADDSSILSYQNLEYLIRLKEMKNKFNLDKLLKVDRKEWFANSKVLFPYTWSLAYYLMDVHPKGRELLFKTDGLRKEEKNFHEWLESLSLPRGYSFFEKSKQESTNLGKIFQLEKAILEEKNFDLYLAEIAKIYFEERNYRQAFEYAEQAYLINPKNKIAIQVLVESSIALDKFPQAEFYTFIAQEWKWNDSYIAQAEKKIKSWRRNFPEIPRYSKPIMVFPAL